VAARWQSRYDEARGWSNSRRAGQRHQGLKALREAVESLRAGLESFGQESRVRESKLSEEARSLDARASEEEEQARQREAALESAGREVCLDLEQKFQREKERHLLALETHAKTQRELESRLETLRGERQAADLRNQAGLAKDEERRREACTRLEDERRSLARTLREARAFWKDRVGELERQNALTRLRLEARRKRMEEALAARSQAFEAQRLALEKECAETLSCLAQERESLRFKRESLEHELEASAVEAGDPRLRQELERRIESAAQESRELETRIANRIEAYARRMREQASHLEGERRRLADAALRLEPAQKDLAAALEAAAQGWGRELADFENRIQGLEGAAFWRH
jgi:hypothetical protein